MRIRNIARLALALAGLPLIALAACSDDEDTTPATSPPTTTSGKYRGILTAPGETALLDVTIGSDVHTASLRPLADGPTPVSGSMTMVGPGGSTTLTGSYDPATRKLTLTATTPRGTYTLEGTSDANGFRGTGTTPNGAGAFSLSSSAAGEATLYCGTYSGDSNGIWNVVLGSNGAATGSQCSGDRCALVSGKVEGTNIKLGDPNDPNGGATGTVSGDTMSGTWTGGSKRGTWSGSKSACGATTTPAPLDAGTDAPVDAPADAPVGVTRETIASGLNEIVDLSVDATHVYFLSGADATVKRCPVAGCGSSAPELVVGSLAVPTSVAASGGTVFWTNGFRYVHSCSAANLPCSGTQFADVGASSYPAHLWIAQSRVYWLSEAGATRVVNVCPIAGCTTGYPKAVYTSSDGDPIHNRPLGGLAVTSTHVYVSSFTGGIGRFDLSTPESVTGTGTSVASTGYGTGNVDSDGTSIRWTVQGEGTVYGCAAPLCGTTTSLLTGQAEPGGTRSNDTHVFGFNRGTPKPGGGGYVAGTSLVWRFAR